MKIMKPENTGAEENSRVNFTAKIERRNPGDDFDLTDLKMSHQECEGGIIEVKKINEELRLFCHCGAGKKFPLTLEREEKIVSIALNGGEIEFPYIGVKFCA